jgi:hypothetical protein
VDDGYAGHWFLLHEDNEIKTIRDFLRDFLEIFGDDQDEIYVELVDDFMDKWKRKNLLAIKTTSSDREVDSPPDPIEELKEVIHNMQFSHEEQCEAMNEQFMAMEDQLEIMEGEFTETYIEYPNPLELELDNEKDKEVHGKILDESMDELVTDFEEIKEFELENIEYLDNSILHPPPEKPISLEDNFEDLEKNCIMVPLTCSFSTSQPKDELMQNYEEMEGDFSLSMSYHYEY